MIRKEMARYAIMLHVTLILANLVLITMPNVLRSILAALLFGACCVLMFRQGAGLGERACSMQASIQRMDGAADKKLKAEAYAPKEGLRGLLLCAVVPLAISLVYFGVYGASLKQQNYIYGQETLEAAENSSDEEAVQEMLEGASVYVNEEGEIALDPGAEVKPMSGLDKAVFALRMVTTILALPYWSMVAFIQSQYVILTGLSYALLTLYPFVWPGAMFVGYLQGPRYWKQTEEAMAKGKRRAKARSRILRGKKGPREQKPMI